MKYKAVLFDLDDTLVKTSAIKWAHHKAVAKQFYNIDLTDEVLAQHWGMPFEPMMAIFYQNSDTPENMLKANLSLDAQFPKELQEDALDLVHALRARNLEIGVVTSILGHLAKKDLLRFGFPAQEFFILQGADDAPFHKPDPRVFDRALELLDEKKIRPHEAIYAGDALMDFYAARGAGLSFLGVTTGFVTQQQFQAEGAQSVSSIGQLLNFISM